MHKVLYIYIYAFIDGMDTEAPDTIRVMSNTCVVSCSGPLASI